MVTIPLLRRASSLILLSLLTAALLAAEIEVVDTAPRDGSVSERPVRSLRVWFSEAPDVASSKLELTGPEGPLEVVGLHSMGEKDLMARVSGRMPDGEYTARWETKTADDQVKTGEWKFTVKRGGGR